MKPYTRRIYHKQLYLRYPQAPDIEGQARTILLKYLEDRKCLDRAQRSFGRKVKLVVNVQRQLM